MTKPDIPLAGVIGSPIAHSRSPLIQAHWLKTNGIAGHYIPMDVAPDDLGDVIRTLPKVGFVGVNITIPHKEAVLAVADLITDRATLIGAANTLIFRRDGKIHADNTDGYGFMKNLEEARSGWTPAAGPAALLGAGGAARAVIAALLDAGVPEILISNRTRVRADALQSEFGKRLRVFDWVQAGNMLEHAALTVNTTSLGMIGKPPLRVPLDGLRAGSLVTDLVYTPLKTKTPLSVFVGAFPGAIPFMLGWVAATNEFGIEPGTLFMLQFFWQFPHFWAIGWFLFDDYKKGGFFMLPTGKRDKGTALQVVLYTVWTVLISLIPVFGVTGRLYLTPLAGVLVGVLGLALLYYALLLYKKMDAKTAKQLMLMSVSYITLVQVIYVADKFIR